MACMHEMAAGMGGVRTAGDLVARMVFKGMRLAEAKEYVAGKLNCAVEDLADEYAMKEIRNCLILRFLAWKTLKSRLADNLF